MATAIAQPKVTATTDGKPVAPGAEPVRKVAIICSKGTLDMAYRASSLETLHG